MDTQNKLKLFFSKLSEPDYVLNSYYSDGLLNKLRSPDQGTEYLERSPLLGDLLLGTFEHVSNASVSVKTFLVRVLAIVSKNELQYSKIFAKHEDSISNAFAYMSQHNVSPGLKVAYIELATNLASHTSGVVWLIKTNTWRNVLQLCYEQQTVFVLRQAYKFASDFLWKLSDLEDETSIKTVLDFMLEPVTKNPYDSVKSVSKEEELTLTKQIEPTLHMLLSILNNDKIYESTLLMNLLIKVYNVNCHLCAIFCVTRREDLIQLISKLIFLLHFAKIFLAKPISTSQYRTEDFMDLMVTYFNTLQQFVKRRQVIPVLDYCNSCHVIWSQAWTGRNQTPFCQRNGVQINIQDQLVIIPLVPILVYIKRGPFKSLECKESLNDYVTKMLTVSCEHTTRAAYSMRDLMFECDPLSMALQSVKRLLCLKSHLNTQQANLIFQGLFYVLKDYDPLDEYGQLKEEEDLEDCTEKVLVMTYVMDTILMLVKNHDISWHESLEVLCLYPQVYNILQRKNLSCKFVVAALNLITMTVKKFLPPNLSLLLESKPGSPLHDIGKLIYTKMHDINWEIKDSALEMLLVCTEISFIKYTPFQKQIIENNLMVVAATIAMNESEFYVQASSLKCLGAATKIRAIWEHLLLTYPNIQDNIISILANNPEGIVRKEAAAVLCEMYQNLKLTQGFKKTLYEHMVSAAISDFHWEVQIQALKFWKIAIQNQLTNQGMLDGNFPPVTFSKETRKIVTLNQTEIHKILIKSLDELATKGCLAVLVKLLQDTDCEIVDNAYQVANELYSILLKYNVCDIILTSNGASPILTEEIPIVKQEIGNCDNGEEAMHEDVDMKSEKVIESILNADDINLLANIYQQRMKLQNEQGINTNEPKVKLEMYTSPVLFVSLMKNKDFKSIIEEKRRWRDGIRSLPSLLDDILGLYESVDEVNSLDCY